ncbi:MAG TPA: hypothetical protein VJ951_15135 [Bacteroidales bacterium]|nr:hypothetical protein [Bacteroidales bacterium]
MRTLFIIIIACISFAGRSQPKTYLGINSGPAYGITRIQDPGNVFEQSIARGRISGITLRQDIITNLFLSTGISIHKNQVGINIFDKRRSQPEYTLFNGIYIPIRVGLRIPLNDFHFSITPHLGYQYGLVKETVETYSINSTINNTSNERVSYQMQTITPTFDNIQLLEAGASIGYRFSNNYQLSIMFAYYSGLNESTVSSIRYKDNNGNPFEASYNYDGSRMEAMLSFEVPVSNLWENRDIRLHKSIERSSTRGNGTKTQRQIYVGLHAASLYRTYTTTNPETGPRSRGNYNPFLFANLNTGIHAGIMFENNFGIDVGGAYQRSSSAFTLSYDQDNEVVVKSKAPLFIEVPLNIRYFYKIYKTDFTLVPAIGGSLLTHLSNGAYEGGSGEFAWNSVSGASTENYTFTGERTTFFGVATHLSMAVEYALPMKFPLNIYAGVIGKFGYRTIDELTVDSSVDISGNDNVITYDGSGWQVTIGARIPFTPGNNRCGTEQRKKAENAARQMGSPY